MRLVRVLVVGAIIAAALTAGSGTAGAAPQASASGNGDVFTGEDFSFGARVGVDPFSADGRVHDVFPTTDPNTQVKGRINCMVIVGNQAYMSGNVTDVSPPGALGIPDPTNFFAYAQDNGEPGQFIDRWRFQTFTTGFFVFDPVTGNVVFVTNCVGASALTFFSLPITEGNIEVDPL